MLPAHNHVILMFSFNSSVIGSEHSMHAIMDQFVNLHAHVIGLQETGAKSPVIAKVVGKYIRFASAADDKGRGCELWFSVDRVIGYDGFCKVKFAVHQFTVVHSSSRAIVVCCQTRLFRVLFASLHAPHCGTPKSIKAARTWWSDMCKLFSGFGDIYGCETPLVVFVDANCRPPAPDHKFVGNALRKSRSSIAKNFYDLISANRLLVPATFEQYLSPNTNGGTYQWDADKPPVCIDYVMISSSVSCINKSACTHFVDILNGSVDHLATCIQVVLPLCEGHCGAPISRRKARSCRALAKSEAHVQHFKGLLVTNLPVVLHSVEPSTHALILDRHVENCACEAFPL